MDLVPPALPTGNGPPRDHTPADLVSPLDRILKSEDRVVN